MNRYKFPSTTKLNLIAFITLVLGLVSFCVIAFIVFIHFEQPKLENVAYIFVAAGLCYVFIALNGKYILIRKLKREYFSFVYVIGDEVYYRGLDPIAEEEYLMWQSCHYELINKYRIK